MLPIVSLRAELARTLRANSRAIIQAPTGSGKSTQVPQFLLDDGLAGEGRIVILQPRRVAARFAWRPERTRLTVGMNASLARACDTGGLSAARVTNYKKIMAFRNLLINLCILVPAAAFLVLGRCHCLLRRRNGAKAKQA